MVTSVRVSFFSVRRGLFMHCELLRKWQFPLYFLPFSSRVQTVVFHCCVPGLYSLLSDNYLSLIVSLVPINMG